MNKREVGKTGEQIAADFLAQNSYTILERNFRSGKYGEIDIIAEEGSLHMLRGSQNQDFRPFRRAFRSRGPQQRHKIRSLAWIYLKQKRMGERNAL